MIEANLPVAHTDKDLAVQWKGVGEESSLYGLFVKHSDMHVLRAVEPSLRLRHVDPMCLPADDSCADRRALNLGPRSQLGHLLLDYQNLRRKRSTIR